VHRAVNRGRHRLAERRSQRRPFDERDGLAGDHGGRDGASGGVAKRRLRPGEILWLRVRHGGGARGDADARDRRHPPVLGERPALFAAVLKPARGRPPGRFGAAYWAESSASLTRNIAPTRTMAAPPQAIPPHAKPRP